MECFRASWRRAGCVTGLDHFPFVKHYRRYLTQRLIPLGSEGNIFLSPCVPIAPDNNAGPRKPSDGSPISFPPGFGLRRKRFRGGTLPESSRIRHIAPSNKSSS